MKKYVIGTIATMALFSVSCSDDHSTEQLTDVISRTPMTFAVSQDTFTRLSNYDYIENIEQLQEFTIVAQVDGEVYQQGNFKYNATTNAIEHAQGETWLWPGDGTKEVTFYATNNVTWRRGSGIDTNDPIVGDERTFTNEMGFYDMVCAYTKVSLTDCQDGVVHLDFIHALAELGILVRGEFPAGVAIMNYRITSIDISGEYDQNYNFSSNKWSKKADVDKINYSYFYSEDGFVLGDTYGSFIEPLINPLQQLEGDTFRFLQPGIYGISIHYWQDNELKTKETEVELKEGMKNRIQLTLPYEPPA